MVRLGVGLTMAAHGYAKIFQGGRLAGTARWFESIGMRPGRLHAPLAALTEIAGGVLFACGLLTPLAAAAIVALMLVAAWTVHRENGFFIVGAGLGGGIGQLTIFFRPPPPPPTLRPPAAAPAVSRRSSRTRV
jgi:putative oxidoreductase